jgi:hypothetical protein
MVGFYAAVTRGRGSVSALRRPAGRVLSAAALSGLVLAAITAAPAAADPVGAVTINGAPARQCGSAGGNVPSADYCVGSAPLVTIILPSTLGETNGYSYSFGVKNDETGGFDAITEIDAVGHTGFGPAYNDGDLGNVDCMPDSGLAIKCPVSLPAQDGRAAGIVYGLGGRSNYTGGLQSVNVVFNYGGAISACAGPAGPGGAASQARVADACTPPSHTKITQAKIKGDTASFRFTAQHASSFRCELLRNRRVLFSHACRSPKPYASALPRGQYVFVVTGVNRAGLDRNPAKKKFTIK